MTTRYFFAVAAALLLSACASSPQRVDLQIEPSMLELGVIPVNHRERLQIARFGNPINYLGLAARVGVKVQEGLNANRIDKAFDETMFDFSTQFDQQLAEALVGAGHRVELLQSARKPLRRGDVAEGRFENDYSRHQTAQPVLLDLYVENVGYLADGLGERLLPTVHIAARLVDSQDESVLFQRRILYNASGKLGDAIVIEGDSEYAFKNARAVLDDVERAQAGLQVASATVIEQLVDALAPMARSVANN